MLYENENRDHREPGSPVRGLSLALLSALLAAGCTALGPDYTRPEVQVEDNWMESADPEIVSAEADYSAWWSAFEDPTLDRLVEMAYAQNLSLQIAGIRVLEARAQLGIAVGSQYPQSQFASGTAIYNNSSDNVSNGGQEFGSFDLAADATWELDFWGKFRRGIESADASLFSSVASYDDLLVTLVSDVANTYVIIRTVEERLAIARQNVTTQRRSLQIADVRFRNGLTTELDVQQALTLLRNTEATIPRLESSLRQAENALSILLGLPPGSARSVLGEPGKIPDAPAEVAVGVPADLLRRRPDVRQAELNAVAQGSLIGVAEADLYPSIALFGTIGLSSDTFTGRDFSDLFEGDSAFFQGGPSFQWNFLNYGRIKNQVRVQDARFQQLLVSYQNTVLQAAQEAEDSMFTFLKRKDEGKFLIDSVNAAQRSVDLALIQYRDGTADYTRVLNSQNSLLEQQDQYTNTRGEEVSSLISMYKALGGGWELREGDQFVSPAILDVMAERTDWGQLLNPDAIPPSFESVEDAHMRRVDW